MASQRGVSRGVSEGGRTDHASHQRVGLEGVNDERVYERRAGVGEEGGSALAQDNYPEGLSRRTSSTRAKIFSLVWAVVKRFRRVDSEQGAYLRWWDECGRN